jgi:low temperature requirement protein LtrA
MTEGAPMSASGAGTGSWRRAMVARRPDEPHRTVTVLELFFDLCFVVAVAEAGAGLHHAIAEDHVGNGVLSYALVFFGIWWAWMNFTWFASAYDTDDLPYRLTTLVQIVGALILAAGVPRAMERRDFTVIVVGYVIMRLAMVVQWLRAASGDPERRPSSLRYAVGITLLQVAWIARLAIPSEGWGLATFVVLAAGELSVPLIAERAVPTTWHPHHIAERYGLFTLIVLGETVLASTVAIQSAIDTEATLGDLATIVAGGLLTVFAMWWVYFAKEAGPPLTSLRAVATWGYGHYLVFGSAAAVGAGLAVNVDYAVHRAHIGEHAAGAAFTVPVALFLLTMWLLHLRYRRAGRLRRALAPAAAPAILASALTPQPVLVTGLLMAVLVAVDVAPPSAQPPRDRPREEEAPAEAS